jgi:hypothetical protein
MEFKLAPIGCFGVLKGVTFSQDLVVDCASEIYHNINQGLKVLIVIEYELYSTLDIFGDHLQLL